MQLLFLYIRTYGSGFKLINMNKNLLYIANWKAYLPHQQAQQLLDMYKNGLNNVSHQVVVCPDTTLLTNAQTLKSTIKIGAQDCSQYSAGAFTGEITAATLASCGVLFCIVGHWERVQQGETVAITALKTKRLLEHNITPIICVDDNYADKLNILYDQIIEHPQEIIIAYEPISAIGTNNIPSYDAIHNTLTNIRKLYARLDTKRSVKIVYGGSVNCTNAPKLKKISSLEGLLIGKASIDFQEFKKIVEC